MPLNMQGSWRGIPMWAWFGGVGAVGAGGFIFYRRWKAARAANVGGSQTGSSGISSPIPGWEGLAEALGPLGGSGGQGALLGYTSDGTPVYAKGPVIGDPINSGEVDVPNPDLNQPARPIVKPPRSEGNLDVRVEPLPGETPSFLAPIAAVAERILPSLEYSAPTPAPASVAAPPAPAIAGVSGTAPGMTQMGQYTVPTNWLPDIAANPVLSAGYSTPPADIRQADWNIGKPYTADSPVPDWQKYGFGSEAQYVESQRVAAEMTARPAQRGSYEWYMANPSEIFQSVFGPVTREQWLAQAPENRR